MSLDAVLRMNRAIVAIEVLLKLDCKFTLNNRKNPKQRFCFLIKYVFFALLWLWLCIVAQTEGKKSKWSA